MPRILTDEETADLLDERKVLPSDWRKLLKPKASVRKPYWHRSANVAGDHGNKFQIKVRDGKGLFDFSIILVVVDADGAKYPLVRFNGKHPSQHTNKWEKRRKQPNSSFRNEFHVHKATERYQTDPECKIDGYAEVTQQYHSFDSALQAFVTSNGFEVEPDRDLDKGKGQTSFLDD